MKFLQIFIISVICALFAACSSGSVSSDVIATNSEFTVTADSVIEGNFVAYAPSPTEIISNYRSEKASAPMWPISFRLAFNMRDNELLPGSFHLVKAPADTIYATACVPDSIAAYTPTDTIAANTRCTLRVDLSAMTEAFKQHGVWVTATGDSIFSDEFNGVWVLGNVAPLSWNLSSLASNNRAKLRPTDREGIYQLDLVLNPDTYQQDIEFTHWKAKGSHDKYPRVSTQFNILDATYNMAIDAITGTPLGEISGSKASLATYLALAYLNPDLCIQLLRSKVRDGVIHQDSASRLESPIVNDRLIWAAAAWQVYCAKGDRRWLEYAFHVINRTVEHDKHIIFCQDFWLIHGCNSFSRLENQYPRWMHAKDYFESIGLGTNVIYAYCHYILSEMADELGAESDTYYETYKRIKENINQRLWNERRGSYCAYLINEAYPAQSATVCNFSQALCMLFDIADDDRAVTLLQRTPMFAKGVPDIYPISIIDQRIDRLPFIQAMWNIASARNANEAAFANGISAQIRQAAFNGFTSNRFSKSDQLLNACANVAVMLRAMAGIELQPHGIEFNPFVPACMPGTKHIDGFRYRNASFDITIEGTGSEIASIKLDKKPHNSNFISNDISGAHSIEITLAPSRRAEQTINMSEAHTRPFTPNVVWYGDSASISNYRRGYTYSIVINDRTFNGVHPSFVLPRLSQPFNIVYIVAKDEYSQSFISQPHIVLSGKHYQSFAFADYANPGTDIVADARKMVEFSADRNSVITIPVEVDEAGEYYLDVCYANGATNTGNCPMCQLVVNTHKQDIIVLPQRGYSEWRYTGYSNMVHLQLLRGKNVLQLQFVPSQNSRFAEKALLLNMRLFKK